MSTRRLGTETARTRIALLDAGERLMRGSGYAAVTSRRLAAEAGVKPQLVHYYFRTMDDLFVAMFQRIAEGIHARQAEALAAGQPLAALWALTTDPADVVLHHEFVALANHRKSIRAEIAAFGERYRQNQIAIVAQALAADAPREGLGSATVLTVLGELVARGLVLEEALGMTVGHAETRAAITGLIARLAAPSGANT